MDISLEFRQIKLPQDRDVCVTFRRDSYACSFDHPERFEQECGKDGSSYIDWLTTRITEFPAGFLHVWRNGEIIGQIEMHPRGQPLVGYINLFYLVASLRGSGLGDALHAYVVKVFEGLGIRQLQLSVSPFNMRALAYYRKHGWIDLGPRHGHSEVHTMELSLARVVFPDN